ncbi:MAG TPA: undecaprenyldiphospho-muramoylpentapeptide beta-N-acetylglucosaminyltransferase [Nitriliruptorales bacterium]|nr:undecaprenyldiphospho-muramoylpentapeptide beta-N-acetylglucosaminyltransferase [Nitriliruptorales bacterium]
MTGAETSERRTVLFGGGGTAGHIFPALAVARALLTLDPGVEAVFVGSRDRLEGRLVPQAGFALHHIDVLPVPRRLSASLLRLPSAVRGATARCVELLRSSAALGAATFGGYVSFPLARAAHLEGLPLVVHEQNSVPGLANRVAARWADRVAVSFPGSADRLPRPERVAVTGNPVREEVLALDPVAARPDALRHFRLHQSRRTVLIFGGSQGARTLNAAAVGSFALWREPRRVQILHAAGRHLYTEAQNGWQGARDRGEGPLVRCVDFIDDMAAAYAAADVVVCRAGATTIAELTALGRASVLVPYPHAAGDHQHHNAEALRQAGAARVIADYDLDGAALVAAVEPLLLDDAEREAVAAAARAFGRPDAAGNVARLLLQELGRAPAQGSRWR